jgi:LemA protein
MLIFWIVLAIVIALVGFVIVGFNKLRTTDIGAQEALGGIDVQLTRRADLIPNLVETVKGYAAHEKEVFEQVTAARAGVQAAAKGDDVPAKAAADAALQQALVRVNAVAENYPDLKANQNFLELQSQLAETENQISFARQYYNDAVATLNKLVVTIPWMLLVGMAGVKAREFYEAPAGSDVAPKVDFGGAAPAVPPASAPPAPPVAPAAPAAPAIPPTTAPPAVEPPAGASEEPPAQP